MDRLSIPPNPELPRFLNIAGSNGFNFRRKDSRFQQRAFVGAVVASADAFYFVLNPNIPLRCSLFEASGRDTEPNPFGTTDPNVQQAELSKLSTEITGDHDWPLTWQQGPVLVVPRRAVRSLRTSLMLGGFELELKDVRIVIFSPIFRRQQMAAYLTAIGWKVQGTKHSVAAPVRDPHTPATQVGLGKTARSQLALGIMFLSIGVVLLLWHRHWIRTAIHGPTPITLADLSKLDDPATLANPWVILPFDKAVDTGVESVERGRFSILLGENRSKYQLIQVFDEWLVARLPTDHRGDEVVGYLDQWWTPLAREKLEEIKMGFPGHDLMPFQLDGAYQYRREAFALLVVVGFLAVIGVFLIVLSRRFSLKGRLGRRRINCERLE
jgi:hypothetical protein